jgi:LysR family glycine cleavage system transcriptional activator
MHTVTYEPHLAEELHEAPHTMGGRPLPPSPSPDNQRAGNAKAAVRMPSLNAIRAFEAVARLMSYRRAASELNVTTSAISHQIKALEDHFDVPLLTRFDGRISLTAAGEKYFRQVSQGLTQLSLATSNLLRARDARVLRVSMAPTLASWWLVPRLDRFLEAFPDISLEVSATSSKIDFALGQFDVAVRYSQGVPHGLHAAAIGKNAVFPVCSPVLMAGRSVLRAPGDLQRHALISTGNEHLVEEPVSNWNHWLTAANHPAVTGKRQIQLSPQGLMLQAVAQGLGVGLARTLVAADALAAGQLVCPFGPAIPLSANYYVVCPHSSARDPDISAFRDWVLAEAKASAALVKIPQT